MKGLEYPEDFAWYEAPDPARSGHWPASQRPNAMLRDPATGYTKRKAFVSPWICVSSTDNDLDDFLEIWKALVENIHNMIESDDLQAEPEYGLANEHILSLMPDCFSKSFFSRALKPMFKYIAPGLRI